MTPQAVLAAAAPLGGRHEVCRLRQLKYNLISN